MSHRRTILSGRLFGCHGKVRNANGVIHLIVQQVVDLSNELRKVSAGDHVFSLTAGRGNETKHGGSALDSREPKTPVSKPRDMYEPDLHIDRLKIKFKNFR